MSLTKLEKKRAILIGVCLRHEAYEDIQKSLNELERLANTAEFSVVGKFIQTRQNINNSYYVGKGFIEDIRSKMNEEEADLLIFENQLSPNQSRNLLKDYEIDAIDRNELILKIFHDHARSNEAKLQVELAELKYKLPRLKKMWSHLDRQGGSTKSSGGRLASRGAGEKQINIDKRKIQEKIHRVSEKLIKMENRLSSERKKRNRFFKKVCLVGYTNAGKSTLFNQVTGAHVPCDDKLFKTLDSKAKSVYTGRGREVIFSDTVGFISNLPHHLVASFRATLRDVVDAHLLINVVDVSNPDYMTQIEEVNKVLKEIEADTIPMIYCFNKVDKVDKEFILRADLQNSFKNSILCSAKNDVNIDYLIERIRDAIYPAKQYKLFVPFTSQGRLNEIKRLSTIIDERFTENGATINALINDLDIPSFQEFFVE